MKKQIQPCIILIAVLLLTIVSACDPDAPPPPSSAEAKSITSFIFSAELNESLTEDAAGTINETSITIIVPDGVDLTALIPAITYDAAAIHPGNEIARDFSNPASYIVMAEDGTTESYIVTAAHESAVASLKTITSFIFKTANNPSLSSNITAAIGTSTITATVPYGTDAGSLVPTIVHTGMSMIPVSETARNFNSSQIYTVTAGDGTTAEYTATVNIGNPPGSVNIMETGQTTGYEDYDDGYYDAGTAWPSPRFSVYGDGIIIDNATGLMWDAFTNATTRNWGTALAFCNNRSIDNTIQTYDDWRMPNINELESLMNYSETEQTAWLELAGFSNMQGNYYWSSTSDPGNPSGAAHTLTFATALSTTQAKANAYYVLPVRGTSSVIPATGQTVSQAAGDDGDLQTGVAWPSPRFSIPGGSSNVIIDELTGLMWQIAPSSDGSTLTESLLEATNDINFEAYNDWRVPNIRELRSLSNNYGVTNQATWLIDPAQGFSNIGAGFGYHSSTTCASITTYMFYVILSSGIVSREAKTTNYRKIYVRGGD